MRGTAGVEGINGETKGPPFNRKGVPPRGGFNGLVRDERLPRKALATRGSAKRCGAALRAAAARPGSTQLNEYKRSLYYLFSKEVRCWDFWVFGVFPVPASIARFLA